MIVGVPDFSADHHEEGKALAASVQLLDHAVHEVDLSHVLHQAPAPPQVLRGFLSLVWQQRQLRVVQIAAAGRQRLLKGDGVRTGQQQQPLLVAWHTWEGGLRAKRAGRQG